MDTILENAVKGRLVDHRTMVLYTLDPLNMSHKFAGCALDMCSKKAEYIAKTVVYITHSASPTGLSAAVVSTFMCAQCVEKTIGYRAPSAPLGAEAPDKQAGDLVDNQLQADLVGKDFIQREVFRGSRT